MICRYDTQAKAHLIDGEPCKRDEHGNPVRHCRARVRCTSHLGWDEYACPECAGKTRANLESIVDLMALMPDEAVERGVDSEAANIAGPHADFVSAGWRLVNQGVPGDKVRDELDMLDPYTCLTYHERVIREEMNHDGLTLVSPTVSDSAGYLMWVLTDLTRSEEGAEMLRGLLGDTMRLRRHMEAVLLDSRTPERGAPCPACVDVLAELRAQLEADGVPKEEWAKGKAPRLVRVYSHWCDREACEKIHVADDSADVWRCPQDETHEWSHETYTRWVEERERMRA